MEKKETTTTTTTHNNNDHPEQQYIELVKKVLENGIKRPDRTDTGTRSVFGETMKFPLDRGFPLLTTKKVFWRGIVEELLWFISGSTDTTKLSEKGVHIWDKHSDESFLKERGLSFIYTQGDIGPGYGFQWRHAGARYCGKDENYDGKGTDQLKKCIDLIKTNPESRRILMSSWNVKDLPFMALPPCHILCQFCVDTNNNALTCVMYQRSADLGLGVPFNIASYALLTHMVAHVCDLTPKEFIIMIGDAHVYLNHAEELSKQIKRKPYPFPTLSLSKEGMKKRNIDDFSVEDFVLKNYKHHSTIKLPLAI